MAFAKVLFLSTWRSRKYCFCRSDVCKSIVFVGLAIVKACLARGFFRQCRSHSRAEQIEIAFSQRSLAKVLFFRIYSAPSFRRGGQSNFLWHLLQDKIFWKLFLKLFANKIFCKFFAFGIFQFIGSCLQFFYLCIFLLRVCVFVFYLFACSLFYLLSMFCWCCVFLVFVLYVLRDIYFCSFLFLCFILFSFSFFCFFSVLYLSFSGLCFCTLILCCVFFKSREWLASQVC